MARADAKPDKSALGKFIRSQRQLAELSQRELAKLCNLSDPYVSQLERGRHDPSLKVLRAVSEALNIRPDTILSYAGWLRDDTDHDVEHVDATEAIKADVRLTGDQQKALISTYKAFLSANASD